MKNKNKYVSKCKNNEAPKRALRNPPQKNQLIVCPLNLCAQPLWSLNLRSHFEVMHPGTDIPTENAKYLVTSLMETESGAELQKLKSRKKRK